MEVGAQPVSRVQLFMILWTVSRQAPLSMGFPGQEYWRGLPCPPPGDLPNAGIEPVAPAIPALQVGSLPLSHQGSQTRNQTVSELVSYKPLRRCLQLFNSICDENVVLKHIHKPERKTAGGLAIQPEKGSPQGICAPAPTRSCISAVTLGVSPEPPARHTFYHPPFHPNGTSMASVT